MAKNIPYRLLASCFTSVHLLYAAEDAVVEYGVGFNLSLDYGVTSIYFSNSSTVDIIKLEGGPSYKEMMRATSLHATADHALLDDALKPGTGAAQAHLLQHSLRDYLPPWLRGYETPQHMQISAQPPAAITAAVARRIG